MAVPGALHAPALSDGLQTLARLPDGGAATAANGEYSGAACVPTVALRDRESGVLQFMLRLTVQIPFQNSKASS